MRKRVLIAAAAVIALMIVFSALFIFQATFLPVGQSNAAPVTITVQPGDGMSRISRRLEATGLIKSRLAFRLYTELVGAPNQVEPGQYSLSPGLNVPQILAKLTAGGAMKQRVTVLPGWSIQRIGQTLADNNLVSASAFAKAASAPAATQFAKDFEFLNDKPASQDLTGFLYPDTYDIPAGTDAPGIVRLMLTDFNQRLASQVRQDIAVTGQTIFQVVTIASLLEKEIQIQADKQMVAGVINNRLKLGMPLQLDSTIAYITGNYSGAFDHGEKTIDSSYNTYLHTGLPPGPICNPSIDDVAAAAHPTPSDYLYYFTARDGRTVFSKTLQEHEINKAKYL